MNSKSGNALVIVLVLITILSLGAAGYFYLQSKQPIQSPELTREENEKINPTQIDETANWKTYTNNEIGIQLKYPDTMYFQEISTNVNPGPIIPFGSFIENKYKNSEIHYPFIGMNLIKTNLTPEAWEKQKGTEYSFVGMGNAPKSVNPNNYFYSGVSDIGPYGSINNVEAIRFSSEGTSYGLKHTIWQLKTGYLIDIYKHTSGVGEISDSVYDQILSTFKFTGANVTTPKSPPASNAKKLIYSLPSGWNNFLDRTGTVQMGYDPNISEVTSHSPGIGIGVTRKSTSINLPEYATFIDSYDGGSRHTNLYRVIGVSDEELKSGTWKGPGFYEKEYSYNNWSCLVFVGVSISQYPGIYGICPLDNSRALYLTAYGDATTMEQFLQTTKILK